MCRYRRSNWKHNPINAGPCSWGHSVCVPRDASPAFSHGSTYVVVEQWGICNMCCLNNQLVFVRSWVTFGNLDAFLEGVGIRCGSFAGNTPTRLNTLIYTWIHKYHKYDIRRDSYRRLSFSFFTGSGHIDLRGHGRCWCGRVCYVLLYRLCSARSRRGTLVVHSSPLPIQTN